MSIKDLQSVITLDNMRSVLNYDPSQSRDAEGQWTRGGVTGGLVKQSQELKSTTFNEARTEMYEKHKVSVHSNEISDPKALAVTKIVDTELTRMSELNGPAMSNVRTHANLSIEYKEGKTFTRETGVHGSTEVSGTYVDANSGMYLAVGIKSKESKPKLNKMEHTVGDSMQTVFRHEYGHHVWYKGMNRLQREEFKSATADLVGPKYNNWKTKHPVSQYAGTSSTELWAESFSAYTNSQYRRGSLPVSVESALDRFVGGG